MIKQIVKNTEKYTLSQSKGTRKAKGQFFTPASIASFMGTRASVISKHISILEPGAGNGLLTASLVKYYIEYGLCRSFSVIFIENDPDILHVLRTTADLLKKYVGRHGGHIQVSIDDTNYLLMTDEYQYDVVICNPPYKKVRKDSAESIAISEYVFGQPNLYTLFMCKAVNNLKRGGNFIFITPRSWVSGNYYKVARKFLLNNLNLTELVLFTDRNNVFVGEDVLQETLITVATKDKIQDFIISIKACAGEIDDAIQLEVQSKIIKNVGQDDYLLLPTSEAEIATVDKIMSFPDTFESLGYRFKTGPVVEFRNESFLSEEKKNGYVPMYRPSNVVNGKCVFPVESGKAQYVDSSAKTLLLPNANTVFLKRMTSKEESRRLQSCVYRRTGDNLYISVENHVNYLVRTDGKALSADEIEWINNVLMSDEYDLFYRIINGSTQVNVSEINNLPLQRRFS